LGKLQLVSDLGARLRDLQMLETRFNGDSAIQRRIAMTEAEIRKDRLNAVGAAGTGITGLDQHAVRAEALTEFLKTYKDDSDAMQFLAQLRNRWRADLAAHFTPRSPLKPDERRNEILRYLRFFPEDADAKSALDAIPAGS
jgi:hypothetical protein